MQAGKLVELAKALYWKPDLSIVDESTTALSQAGRDLLYGPGITSGTPGLLRQPGRASGV